MTFVDVIHEPDTTKGKPPRQPVVSPSPALTATPTVTVGRASPTPLPPSATSFPGPEEYPVSLLPTPNPSGRAAAVPPESEAPTKAGAANRRATPPLCTDAYTAFESPSSPNHINADGGFNEEKILVTKNRAIRGVTVRVFRLTDAAHGASESDLPPSGSPQSVRIELEGEDGNVASANFVTHEAEPVRWTLPTPFVVRGDYLTLRVVNISPWRAHVMWVSDNPYSFGHLISDTGPHAKHDLGGRVLACDR